MKDQAKTKEQLIGELRGMRERVAELEASKAEAKQAREALKESEKRFRQIGQALPEVLWMVSADMKEVLYISPAYEEVWGRTCESAYKNPASGLAAILPEDRDRLLAQVAERTQPGMGDTRFRNEFRIVRPDGSIRWIGSSTSYIRDDQGQVYRICGVAKDITELKRAAEALRESEQRYRLFAENVSDVIVTAGLDMRWTYVSPSVTRLAGYGPDELIGRPVIELLTPACAEVARTVLTEELAGEKAPGMDPSRERSLELEFIRKDGSTGWAEGRVTFLRDPEGRPTGALGVIRETTDRKRAEQALREKEEAERCFAERLAALVEVTNALSQSRCVEDLCRRAVEFGRSRLGFDRLSVWLASAQPGVFSGTFGVDEKGQLRDERGSQMTPATDSATCRISARQISSFHQADTPLYNDRGEVVGRGSLAIAALWDGEKVLGCLTTDNLLLHQPITERQRELLALYASALGHLCTRIRAEEALRESEERFRQMAEAFPDVLWVVSADMKEVIYVSPAYERIWGRTCESLYKQPASWLAALQPEDHDRILAQAVERIQAKVGQTKFRNQFRIARPDGSIRWIRSSTSYIRNERGEVYQVCGVAEDVTDLKRAEEESDTLARLGTRLAATASVERMITVVREETDHLFGWDAHYFAVRRPEEDTFHVVSFVDTVDGQKKTFPKEDWPTANLSPPLRQILRDRPVLINRRPGDRKPDLSRFGNKDRLSSSLMHVPVRSGEDVIGILSVQSYTPQRYSETDLQALQRVADAIAPALQRAHAEEALKKAEEQFRTLFEHVPIGLYRTTPDGRILMANPALVRMLGYSCLEEMTTRNLEQEGFEPEYPRSVFKERVEAEGEVVGLDSAWTTRDGHVVFVRESARAVRDEAGNTLYYEGSAEDITEKKQAEKRLNEMFEQIKKSHGDLLSILNMLRLGVVMVDPDGCITFINQTAERLTGQSQKAALGRRWKHLFSFRTPGEAGTDRPSEAPLHGRKRFQAHTEFEGGRNYWMDVEIQDDPRNPQRKIYFLYDISEIYDLRRMLEAKAQFHDLVGKSKPMQSVYQRIQEVAKVDWTVLIEGETGTGKELVARAIHYSGHRKERPFIAVNCAGLTDSLLTSQLFGHKRGSFTGAVEDHKGLFEVANGGTLFLDEIGDISKSMQRSLLRVLEEKEITPLGQSKARKVDVRILASTHRDLSQQAERGNFRPDLLYRIRVARIQLPPLRERREDIPLLVGAFLSQSRAATGKAVEDVSHEAMRILLEYDWPGNVRELKSAIDVATLHCKGTVIQPEDLPPEIRHPRHRELLLEDQYKDEKKRILAALESANGRRTAAARLLGISRATLYRHMASLGIRRSR